MKQTLSVLLLTAGLGLAQQQDVLYINERVPAPMGAEPRMFFFGRTAGESVKNAPYTADSVTEMTQSLPDGNRIRHENKSSFARDSEGRTRRETVIQGLGALGRTDAPLENIVIHDPVAKASYVLNPKKKTAMRMPEAGPMPIQMQRGPGGATVDIQKNIIVSGPTPVPANGGPSPITVTQFRHVNNGPASKNVRQEDLGTRMIEGVNAKGTRTTLTIPAGEIGNERAMEVVTETWYSEAIKAAVLTRHTDPRMGETVTRLTNLKLGEPARSLFEVPADYTIEEPKKMNWQGPNAPVTIKDER